MWMDMGDGREAERRLNLTTTGNMSGPTTVLQIMRRMPMILIHSAKIKVKLTILSLLASECFMV